MRRNNRYMCDLPVGVDYPMSVPVEMPDYDLDGFEFHDSWQFQDGALVISEHRL